MRRNGTLSVDSGISSLDGTTLAMAGTNPLGAATDFLANRGLNDNEFIWVEGNDGFVGDVPVILITNAGRP
jgi:hypothetical protein